MTEKFEEAERSARRSRAEEPVRDSYETAAEKGGERLHRSWKSLLATGFLGGVDISVGVLAYLLTLHETDSHLLAGLAFSIGFIALYFAHAELFTEDFYFPVMALFGDKGTWLDLVRLWSFTLLMNLIGGWLVMAIVVVAYPSLHEVLGTSAAHFIDIGLSWQGAALAVLAGMTITLMTRMHAGSDHAVAIVAAAISGGFVLAGGSLMHSVLDSILIFGAIQAGEGDIGYLDWLGWVWWVIPLNVLGGVLLTTSPRLLRATDVRKD